MPDKQEHAPTKAELEQKTARLEKRVEKMKDAKSELEQRLAAVENLLATGFGVDLSAYDPVAIAEARDKALAEAGEKAKAELEAALASARMVHLSDSERITRLEQAIQHTLGRSL
jgi:hypothetical protein